MKEDVKRAKKYTAGVVLAAGAWLCLDAAGSAMELPHLDKASPASWQNVSAKTIHKEGDMFKNIAQVDEWKGGTNYHTAEGDAVLGALVLGGSILYKKGIK